MLDLDEFRKTMEFFDCNILYGMAATKCNLMPALDVQFVLSSMKHAGIAKALVRREEQFIGGVGIGNQLVANDVKETDNLWGVWSIIPDYTHEIPEPEMMLTQMKVNRIAAWQLVPNIHCFSLHYRPLKPWLELACRSAIPIIIKLGSGIINSALYDILEKIPELVIILSSENVWPCDRNVRPFLKEFPNCYFEISQYLTDGGIEELVSFCGAKKLLFGTGFHQAHFGGIMLMLRQAQISEVDKQLIASKNIISIIESIKYD
jgi:predicted TIM-barrel fold metal-dependent hydrolase